MVQGPIGNPGGAEGGGGRSPVRGDGVLATERNTITSGKILKPKRPWRRQEVREKIPGTETIPAGEQQQEGLTKLAGSEAKLRDADAALRSERESQQKLRNALAPVDRHTPEGYTPPQNSALESIVDRLQSGVLDKLRAEAQGKPAGEVTYPNNIDVNYRPDGTAVIVIGKGNYVFNDSGDLQLQEGDVAELSVFVFTAKDASLVRYGQAGKINIASGSDLKPQLEDGLGNPIYAQKTIEQSPLGENVEVTTFSNTKPEPIVSAEIAAEQTAGETLTAMANTQPTVETVSEGETPKKVLTATQREIGRRIYNTPEGTNLPTSFATGNVDAARAVLPNAVRLDEVAGGSEPAIRDPRLRELLASGKATIETPMEALMAVKSQMNDREIAALEQQLRWKPKTEGQEMSADDARAGRAKIREAIVGNKPENEWTAVEKSAIAALDVALYPETDGERGEALDTEVLEITKLAAEDSSDRAALSERARAAAEKLRARPGDKDKAMANLLEQSIKAPETSETPTPQITYEAIKPIMPDIQSATADNMLEVADKISASTGVDLRTALGFLTDMITTRQELSSRTAA